MEFEPVIGLEVHLQSKTKSKMFCGCSSNYFGKNPNTNTCPVCLGLPGAMPVPNEKAIELCIKLALGLNCKIAQITKFDRKNYFYPDLPKGYQISQYDKPIGYEGCVEIKNKKIGITRIHQEEDTGKSIHRNGITLLDFNKSGVPLIEIVSEPDLSSIEEVDEYAKILHQTARMLEISDADMEKGQMRFELNISLRKVGTKDLPSYKVEVKNIGSISVLKKVIEKEIIRQSEIIENGELPKQETRGLIDMQGNTQSQRLKETSDDYRYFAEPDIPPIKITEEYIKSLKSTIQEGPVDKVNNYISKYGLDENTAKVIIADSRKMKIFESAITNNKDKKVISNVANIVIGPYASYMKKGYEIKPSYICQIALLVNENKIEKRDINTILSNIFKQKNDPTKIIEDYVKDKQLKVINIEKLIDKVIKDNPKVINDFENNPNAIMYLVGVVMRETNGKADPQKTKEMIIKAIQDR